MKNLNQFQFIWTDPSTDPLLVGCGTRPMQYTQRRGQYSDRHLHVYHQLLLVGYHDRWLASHALSRCKHPCSGKPALETGEVLGFSESCVFFAPSANVISVRKGFVWLLLATVVALVPMVRPVNFLVSFLTRPHPCYFCAVGIHLFGPKWCFSPFQTHKEER